MSWLPIALKHIKHFEGLRLEAYPDGAGKWAVGYGHTAPDVYPGLKITKKKAERLLVVDMDTAASAIDRTVKAPINDEMKAALVGLVFNIGVGAWGSSTALRRLNAEDYAGAAEAITWWNKARSSSGELTVWPGLVRRREAERNLFMSGLSDLMGRAEETDEDNPSNEIEGGAQKTIAGSKTIVATAVAGAGTAAPLVQAFENLDWRIAIPLIVVVGALIFLVVNRIMEANRGEH